jgi:predicted outer membrane repeat protein
MRNQLKIVTVIVILSLCSIARGQTVIKDATVKGIWSKAGSPYFICNDVNVLGGDTLVIEPGVKVYFTGYYGLFVEGKIKATGLEKDSIIFNFKQIEATGEEKNDSVKHLVEGWKGIKIAPTAPDTFAFSFCRITGANAVAGRSIDGLGGAIAMTGKGHLEIDRCLISGNRALIGTGLFCQYANVSVTRSIFENNVSIGDGGAIYAADCSPFFSANYIIQNRSGEFGGAVVCKNAPGIFINNLIARNTARFGGAMALMNSNIKSVNNTIADNIALVNGGGIHCTESNPVLINTIVWGNKSDKKTDQLYLYQKSAPYISYTDIDGGIGGIRKFTNTEQLNPLVDMIMQDDPGFMKNTTSFYGLKEFSSCIDQGVALDSITCTSLDIIGNLRIMNGFPDVGAYEFISIAKNEIKDDDHRKLSQDEDNQIDINIYPNPSKGKFWIEFSGTDIGIGIGEIRITNIAGQVVHEIPFRSLENGSYYSFEIELTRGAYFVELVDQKNEVHKCEKVIIE